MWEVDDAPPSLEVSVLEASLAAFPAMVPAAPADMGSAAVEVGESDEEEESVASAVDVTGRASLCEPVASESVAAVAEGCS